MGTSGIVLNIIIVNELKEREDLNFSCMQIIKIPSTYILVTKHAIMLIRSGRCDKFGGIMVALPASQSLAKVKSGLDCS